MKIKSYLCTALVVLLILAIPVAGIAETMSVKQYLEGFEPSGILVCAYDPTRQTEGKVFYDALSLEYNLGDTNEDSGYLKSIYESLQRIDFKYLDDSVTFPESHWRFSILYGVSSDAPMASTRWFQMDFFDKTDMIRLVITEEVGDESTVLLECGVILPIEDSLALENVYIDTVARLRRIPSR